MADKPANREIVSRKEAKALGRMYYYTGRPCKRGHVDLRVTSSEMCAVCSREASAKRYIERCDESKRRHREWYYENRDYVLTYSKVYYKKNKEVRRQYARQRRAADPDLARQVGRRSHAKHKIKRNQNNKRWYAKHPNSKRAYRYKREARKRQNGGAHTAADIATIFKAQRGKCAYCHASVAAGFHLDHIMPLAKGGTNDRRNLQVLCGHCNIKKHARDPIEHARTLGMLL